MSLLTGFPSVSASENSGKGVLDTRELSSPVEQPASAASARSSDDM